MRSRWGGEIGRRARLRIWFRKEYGFKSLPQHHLPAGLSSRDRPDEFSEQSGPHAGHGFIVCYSAASLRFQ